MSNDADPMAGADPMASNCTATAKSTGNRCLQPAIPGGTVCRYHGGAAPQVKAKAEERLAEKLKVPLDLAVNDLKTKLEAGGVDSKVVLDAIVKLAGLIETLEGRVSNRTEIVTPDAVEAEILRLEAQFAASE
jgi:hypothetical protein